MSPAATVVISAAGLGTRLGLNTPKVLVELGGKTILQHHLELLEDCEDVVVVAGYMASSVIEVVRDLRPDVVIALNHDFASTGTAASLVKGAQVGAQHIISLDGDLLVARDDFYALLENTNPCLGLTHTTSSEPVCARLTEDREMVVDLSQEWRTEFEWSGLLKAPRTDVLQFGKRHVFQGVKRTLPMNFLIVDCVEIDHPSDLLAAETWLRQRAGVTNGGH